MLFACPPRLPPRVAIELKSLRSPLRTDSKRLTCLTCEREGSPPRSRLARQKNESAVKAFLILRVLLGFPALSKNQRTKCFHSAHSVLDEDNMNDKRSIDSVNGGIRKKWETFPVSQEAPE